MRRLSFGINGRMTKVYFLSAFSRTHSIKLTFQPWWNKLQPVDELGVKTGGDFDTHTCWIQEEIKKSEIALSIPRYFVFFHKSSENWISLIT